MDNGTTKVSLKGKNCFPTNSSRESPKWISRESVSISYKHLFYAWPSFNFFKTPFLA